MDRETLSNYGWITIVTLVLAVMLALATPFGTYVGNGVVSIARGYVATSEKKLNNDNVKEMGSKWDGKFENGVASGEGGNTTEMKREAGSVIPTGATYTPSGKTALTGNGTNKFPDTPSSGDVYEEGDYKYKFNFAFERVDNSISSRTSDVTGWGIIAKDATKSSYGTIVSTIAGKSVANMTNTFSNCKNLIIAPQIPNTVIILNSTFKNCTSLTTVSTIPESVTQMTMTFDYCTSLVASPAIPQRNNKFKMYV